MDLTVIILSWNVKNLLRENLSALLKSDVDFEFQIYVVDNNSRDGSSGMVRKEFLNVELIENSKNLGFAKANNQVIRRAKTDYILLLNSDMKVENNTLQNIVDWAKKNQQATVCGGHLIDQDGKTIKHVRRFPRIWDQLLIILKFPHLFPNILKNYIREDFDYSQVSQVDSIRGGFFLINRKAIKKLERFPGFTLPEFDERYFFWFEEVDYCRQVKKAGGEVWYTPVSKCVDYIGQSAKQLPRAKSQVIMKDSQLKYFKKWHPLWQYCLLKSVWPIGTFIVRIAEMANLKTKAKT